LALIEAAGTAGAGILPEDGVILPRKALQELMKILDGEGEVRVAVDAPYVQVAWEGTVFVLRTVEGRFPSYRAVIPEATSRTAFVDRQALLAAIDRVSLVVTDRFKSVTVRFESDTMTLIARNPDMGEGEEAIECEYDGEPLDVGFNANYIQEALGEISTDRVEVKLIDDVSPALIYGEEDRSYLNVIMPMRI
jgi:DNA polymerase-3 subunit beta